MSKTIYDFGMNNGDDIEYYLKKGLKVVGVDANSHLCKLCEARFSERVQDGQLTILNVALAGRDSAEPVTFYIHKSWHPVSQLQPTQDVLRDFEPVLVSQRRASNIIAEFGEPYYIKIDLEGVDQVILADLIKNNILPDFVSAESHSIDVFCWLVAGGYTSFNLVHGPSVHELYANAQIASPGGTTTHCFKRDSAGPFGEDIITPWRTKTSLFNLLALEGTGWKDIHATNLITPVEIPYPKYSRKYTFREHMEDLIPSFVRSIKFRLERSALELPSRGER
jgi:FkbM family methyltransferase